MTREALPADPAGLTRALAESAAATDSPVTPNAAFDAWFGERRGGRGYTVRRVPLDALTGWHFEPGTGDLRHDTGGFFAVEGLRVRTDQEHGVGSWDQPVMSQREIGVLGFLVRQFDGVPHFLVQAKMEPGNVNTVHLAPSVQATRSNLAGVHRGRGTHHVEHFAAPRAGRVLVDSLQSERGSWFLHKRNRHMVVEPAGPVADREEFRWLTLGQLRRLLTRDNLLTMEACSVLSCLPPPYPAEAARDGYAAALLASLAPRARTVHTTGEVIGRINEIKARYQLGQQVLPLDQVKGWQRDEDAVRRPDGRYFEVIGTEVWAGNREVAHWTQPLLAPVAGGVAALLTKVVDGVLHLLLHARSEAGLIDVAELCPTVQCTPSNHADAPPGRRPRYLDDVLAADPAAIRYDTVISEEGARFYQAESRYLVIEVPDGFGTDVPDDFVWVTMAQVGELLRHSYYLNMQARTLLAALHAIW